MSPWRITAILVLCAIAFLFAVFGILNLYAFNPSDILKSRAGYILVPNRTYVYIDFLVTGTAAFGAVVVYWSRPRYRWQRTQMKWIAAAIVVVALIVAGAILATGLRPDVVEADEPIEALHLVNYGWSCEVSPKVDGTYTPTTRSDLEAAVAELTDEMGSQPGDFGYYRCENRP